MYHSVDKAQSVISVLPSRFRAQVKWLHDNGYKSLAFGKFGRYLIGGNEFPKRTIAFTFDDGYQNLYTEVFPILQEYGYAATVFLISGYCGKYNDWPGQSSFIPRMSLLNWEQIGEMSRYGIEFGSHTRNHPRLDQLSMDALRDEIIHSKKDIEDRLGDPVSTFAYPYGRYNKHIRDLVSDHYELACSTRTALADLDSDRFEVERIEISYLAWQPLFEMLSHRVMPHYLSVRRTGRSIRSLVYPNGWK